MLPTTEEKKTAIKDKINRKFIDGGCVIDDAHFENGRNLHSNQYYFAKNYFQNNENSVELAEVLAAKLSHLDFPDDTTLIGFRNYSGLLLKATTELLGKYNYAIVEEGDDDFYWRHLPSLNTNLVVILPIACTGITYIRLRKFLTLHCSKDELRARGIKVNDNFIVVFLIIDESLEENRKIILKEEPEDSKAKHIYSAFNWTEINPEQVIFNSQSDRKERKNENSPRSNFTANSIIRLFSEMQLPEECSLCFPDKVLDEKPLFPTHDDYENPNLIFKFPNFSGVESERKFHDTFCLTEESCDVILRGHIDVNNTSYSNYVRGNTFYINNHKEILAFFETELSLDYRLRETDKNIIFITSENNHGSYFLEDFALSPIFQGKKVTVLRFQPGSEFVDNFVSLYGDIFTETEVPPKIIYFEDVMSAGKAFKLVSDYIKHARLEKLATDSKSNPAIHGFDLVLTLVDRTTAYTHFEIIRKLYSDTNKNPQTHFISYFKLNIPIISDSHIGNPLNQKIEYLRELLNQCHLDSLKGTIGDEIRKRLATALPEIGSEDEPERRLDYFPFGVIEKSLQKDLFEIYQHYFNPKRLDLLTTYLTHKINSELFGAEFDEPKYRDDPERFIIELIEKVEISIVGKVDQYFVAKENNDSRFRNREVEKDIIRDTIIKTLTAPPFIYYRNIYEPVFYYCLEELERICDEIEEGHDRISFRLFRKLKFYIRRSIELNSNFIVSSRFLGLLKRKYSKEWFEEIIKEYDNTLNALDDKRMGGKIDDKYFKTAKDSLTYKREQFTSFFSFLLFYYKQLMSKNPAISIRLEELINSEKLLPTEMEVYNNSNGDVGKLMSDPYFQFTGMVKAENLYLLNDLKNLHKNNLNTEKFHELKSYKGYYLTNYDKNDPVIVNAQKLLRKSRHWFSGLEHKDFSRKLRRVKAENYGNIKSAIFKMLKTVELLESKHKKQGVTGEISETNLNNEIKEILNSVLGIIEPGINKANLKYAFFVETRKKVNEADTSNIYSITSDEVAGNPSDIKLDVNGFISNFLYGLLDSETKNEQSLIAAARLSDGRMASFNDYYYVLQKNNFKTYVRTKFTDLFTKDLFQSETRKGVIFYDGRGKPTKVLDEANMFIALRFANVHEPDKTNSKYRFEGRAVLLIMSTEPATANNFLNFMSNEKVRLLLLIKEDLLKYLEKQFYNDAFGEVLENKKNTIFKRVLRHGLSGYLNILDTILDGIFHDKSKNLEFDIDLCRILINAVRGQVREFKFDKNQEKEYFRGDIIGLIEWLFTAEIIPNNRSIELGEINTLGLPDLTIRANELIIDVVFPELLINMKQYGLRKGDSEFLVSYDDLRRTFTFENLVEKADYEGSIGHIGGYKMCEKIMDELRGAINKVYLDTRNGVKCRVTLTLPQSE